MPSRIKVFGAAFAITLSMVWGSTCMAQPSKKLSDTETITQLLHTQQQYWNEGNLNLFMQSAYWQNDSLQFIGKKGLTYGFEPVLNNYKQGYSDTAAMGKLQFDILQIRMLSKQYAYVVGKWHLTRSQGNLQGHFTLLWKKIRGVWKIISDHSS